MKFGLIFVLLTALLGAFAYQNCAPSKFTTEVQDMSSLKNPTGTTVGALTCNESERPPSEVSAACPSGTTGLAVVRTRSVICSSTEYVVGEWSNPNYSACTCVTQGQVLDPLTGTCAFPPGSTCNPAIMPSALEFGNCPTGTGSTKRTRAVTCNPSTLQWQAGTWSAWDESLCVVIIPTCDPAVKPPVQEMITCPSNLGTATRTREVSCPTGSTQWSVGAWMNNYSSCQCPATGQTLNNVTGACTCPAGQSVIDGACKVPTCDPTTKPASSQSVNCPSGSGTATQTRTVNCPTGSTTWQTGAWGTNYSTCNCSMPGQTPNPTTGICACPTGQVVAGGICKVPQCDPALKGPESQSGLTCPNNSAGTYTQTRRASCNQTTYNWQYTAWVADYSTCACPIQGQVFDSQTRSCSCPAGQVVNGNSCVLPPACPQPQPSSTEYKACPSNIGMATRPVSVSCANGAIEWTVIPGAWDYSACGCQVIGAQVNPSTGACGCVGGTYEISGQCEICPVNTIYDSASKTCRPKTCAHPDTGAPVPAGGTYSYYTRSTAPTQTECNNAKYTKICQADGTWNFPIATIRFQTCTVVAPPPPVYNCPSSRAIGWAAGTVAPLHSQAPGSLPNGNPWCYYQVMYAGDMFCVSVDKITGQTHREGKCCGGNGTDPYMAAKYGSDCKGFYPCNPWAVQYGGSACNYGMTMSGDPYGAYTCTGNAGDVFQCQGFQPYVDYGGAGP